KPFGIKYIINARANSLNEEMAELLEYSGCREVRIGFETGNETLRNEILNKRISDEALENALNLLHKHNIMGVAFMMMGVPGETWDTFFDTIKMTIKLEPRLIRMTFLNPYVHTRIYDNCVARGLMKDQEISDNRDMDSPLKFDNLTDEDLFMFRFLFPWFVNAEWFDTKEYLYAINEFSSLSITELQENLLEIRRKDKMLSENCKHTHYRYYAGNDNYFELYDNNKNPI
ncbi:MAG: radical SAM protein, partial [Bacteroidales bacterium]